MLKMDFENNDQNVHHVCNASRDGDWIVYQCPKCDYVRREHIETDESVVENIKAHIHHSGFYVPLHYLNSIDDRN